MVAVPGAYGNQAVALRIKGNKAMFYRVRILGTQDTLLDDYGSHYFYQCYVQGSIDFIFGSSRSLYQVSSYLDLQFVEEIEREVLLWYRFQFPSSFFEKKNYSYKSCLANFPVAMLPCSWSL